MKNTETKHTKGEWTFDKVTETPTSSYEIHSNNFNNWVASIKCGNGGIAIGELESKANAKLIAAAPDMLKVLEEIKLIVATIPIEYNYTEFYNINKLAVQVIQKATS